MEQETGWREEINIKRKEGRSEERAPLHLVRDEDRCLQARVCNGCYAGLHNVRLKGLYLPSVYVSIT